MRYQAVNAMLLNEFLKEHRKVETKALKEQGAQIQKVSAQMSVERPSTRMAAPAHCQGKGRARH